MSRSDNGTSPNESHVTTSMARRGDRAIWTGNQEKPTVSDVTFHTAKKQGRLI